MSQPMVSRREAQSLEDMLANTDDVLNVDQILEKMGSAQAGQHFRPADDLLKFIYLLSVTREGRPFFDWLMDLTIRAPFPPLTGSFEQAAMCAAKYQTKEGLGNIILEAIAEGKRLVDQSSQRS